jgi:hypothetical protein
MGRSLSWQGLESIESLNQDVNDRYALKRFFALQALTLFHFLT